MKAPLIAAAIVFVGLPAFAPAYADCGAAHPQAQSTPAPKVLAQSSDPNSSTMKSDEANKQNDDDDDDN